MHDTQTLAPAPSVLPKDFTVILTRDTNVPAVLVETGYLSNPRECETPEMGEQ